MCWHSGQATCLRLMSRVLVGAACLFVAAGPTCLWAQQAPGDELLEMVIKQLAAEEQDMRNFIVRIQGRDSELLATLGLDLQEILEKLPEVEMAEVSSVRDNEEIVVDVDRDRVQELEVGPESLFATLSGGLQGRELTRFEERGRDVRLVARLHDKEDPTLTDLKETPVFSRRGNFQRLADMSRVQFKKTLVVT